ncbi:hypothetical protein QBC37DRAFT_322655 [Rhypophila decipiens]|uniref:Protein kinase domain-containing protein n=1 Tax=Rhypophila decipiens TaxID=261697 RepID=A0AAN6Y041_9PEZI|nr:hypothetical protein QBC37DRAFT_322655 [Rhypophila decipiens]
MEPLSALTSALTLAKLLLESLKLGRNCVETLRNRSAEAAKLALRMSLAMDRGEALHNLMFGTGSVGGVSSPGRAGSEIRVESDVLPVFHQLRYKTSMNVMGIVNQYHDVIHSRYRDLRQSYPLEADTVGTGTSSSQKSTSIQTQLSWMLRGKRLLQSTVEDCERLNDLLTEIIQLYLLEKSPIFTTVPTVHPSLTGLKTNTDVKNLGLDEEIDLIRIASSENQDWENLEIEVTQFEESFGLGGQRKIGHRNGWKVLVEFKKVTLSVDDEAGRLGRPGNAGGVVPAAPDAKHSAPTVQRIRQLATILHRNHSSKSRLLHCQGLYWHAESSSYGFVHQFPPGRSTTPKSLLGLLELSSSRSRRLNGSKPALEARLNLALTLAIALFQFHAVGWVHKSIRSENLIFFSDEGASLSDVIGDPWLIGFEYAREETGFSEKANRGAMIAVDPSTDLYRHPDIWNGEADKRPTTRFDKQHDIYSLGVLLLEIGLWQPVGQFDKHNFTNAVYDDRFDIRKLFLKKASEELPFLTGSLYASIVARCLSGLRFDPPRIEGVVAKVDPTSSGAQSVDLAELFRDQVSGTDR